MTVEEKRDIVRKYCMGRNCYVDCVVGRISREDGSNVCYQCATEEQLDRRIAAIEAEKKSAQNDAARESKIAALDEHCDGTTCSDCPCCIDDLKKYCVDGHTCDFDEMSDEGLDAYLRAISPRKSAVAADTESRESVVATAVKAIAALRNTEAPDNVNHPKHYELPNGLECIDVLLATQGKDFVMGFCICNAMKYLYRHKRKNGVEDIKKARWYITKYLELEAQDHD